MNALRPPEGIGTLNSREAEMFSANFRHDWQTIRENNRLYGCEGIYLFGAESNTEEIDLPPAYDQFLPAIIIAAQHEKTIRGDNHVSVAMLTIRQSEVQTGRSQQGGSANWVHRDTQTPDYFYTVADVGPTQYYPQIESRPGMDDGLRVSDEVIRAAMQFQPYDIVGASTMVYHRSPQFLQPTRRTFVRLAFTYDSGNRI